MMLEEDCFTPSLRPGGSPRNKYGRQLDVGGYGKPPYDENDGGQNPPASEIDLL